MPASPEELIAINSLLIKREAAFARVHSVESRISELLGEPYPFEAPAVELPSRNKKKASKASKHKQSKSKPFKPRRLNQGEVAYRLCWIDKGQEIEQCATDLKCVTSLITDSLPGLKLHKIETIDLNNETIEVLICNP
jgi:hypothetical protein